jgi:hypothetical protein
MNDKYAILAKNPQYCKRLFGVEYGTFETILQKVQERINVYLTENPLSNRGILADFSVENRSGEPSSFINLRIFKAVSYFFEFRIFLWNFRELCKQNLS